MSYNESRQSLSLPPRWLKCPRKGDIIAGKFIPFKTPLDDKYKSQISPSDLFTPQMFISLVANCYKVKLGLWIDLTFTSRFYNKSIVEEKNINHDECPTEEQTQLFVHCCANYISKNPLDVIGVHCTHGFNRTGFLICAYLIEKDDWSVEAAVVAFAKSRPPGIYKESYLKELFRRYGDVDDAPPAPPLPDWCHESDGTRGMNGQSDGTDDEGVRQNTPSNNRQNNHNFNNHKICKFMDGVSGVTVADPLKTKEVQHICQRMSKFKGRGFPGSQPVSMDMQNIGLLEQKEYMVSWKADGTRYMLLIIGGNESYFIDRDNNAFKIDGIKFFKRKEFPNHLENTLLDGEMILDSVNGQTIARYLIYDIICFESQEVGGTEFRRRLFCIDKEIIGPRERAKAESVIDRSREPFGVRKKDFWEVRDTFKIFDEKFTRNLSHEIDGLIFQPVPEPYIAGQCDVTLKWKPPTLNSVDFRLNIMIDDRPGMLRTQIGALYVNGLDRPFDQMKVNRELKQYDKKIIECSYDLTKGQWIFLRERTDKSFPNHLKTAISVCNSIRNPITKEILLEFIETRAFRTSFKRPQDGHSSGSDSGLMPPPMKAPRKS